MNQSKIYKPKRRKATQKWADVPKVSVWKIIFVVLYIWGISAVAGLVVGYSKWVNRPHPVYYVSPIGSLDDVKVFKVDYEAVLRATVSEIWDGEKFVPTHEFELVKKAHAEVEREETRGDIPTLIADTFGRHADVALCIAKAESGLNPSSENRGKALGRYRGECSIGLFQINLRSNGCTGRAVHWAKAQGETLEEKIEWLKVPENNVKVAKQIFEASYWNAWSTKHKCI